MADYKRTVASNKLDTTWIRKKTVSALDDKLVMANLITPAEIPANMGSTARYVIDGTPTGATGTTALDYDAGTPITFATRDAFNEDTYAPTTVEKQIHTYGTFIPVRRTDLRDMPKGQMETLSDRLSYRGASIKDTLLRAAEDGSGAAFAPGMGAGTTTTRKSIGDGTNDTTLSATDYLTAEDLMLGWGDLEALNAQPFDNGNAVAVIHSGAGTHLKTDVSTSRITWFEAVKHVSGYNGQEKILKGSIGNLGGVEVLISNNITTSTVDTRSAYNNLIMAKDALGCIKAGESDPDVKVNRSGPSSMSDPYRIWATVSFLFRAAPALLDVNRSEILYSTV